MTEATTPARRTLQDWFDIYALTHTHPVNKALHKVCVPVIFVTVIGLLNEVDIARWHDLRFTAAWLLLAFGIAFYARLSLLAGVIVGGFAVALVVLGNVASEAFGGVYTTILGALFVLAWIGQFVGHKIEGAKPAFFDDLLFLFIGPLWVARECFGRTGTRTGAIIPR